MKAAPQEFAAACQNLLSVSVEQAKRIFGETLPKELVDISYMMPDGPGRHSGRHDRKVTFSSIIFLQNLIPAIEKIDSWITAKALVQSAIEQKGGLKATPWDTEDQYLKMFLLGYFEKVETLSYDKDLAD